MLFWIAAALVTVVALTVVLWPFLRSAPAVGSQLNLEVALYQGQIGAIAREQAEGRISPRDAEATRIEVKRRMLTAARRRDRRSDGRGGWFSEILDRPRSTKAAFVAIGSLVPIIALAVYLSGGSPTLPDQPYASRAAARAAAGMPSQEELLLVRKLAAQMASHPQDPKGWALLGAAYVRQSRYDDAVAAYTNAVKRGPQNAEYESALGEARVLQAGGEVTEPARAAFKRALEEDKTEPRARYFIALAKAQTGNVAGAVEDWTKLLKDAPARAPWRARVEAQLKQARAALSKEPSTTTEAMKRKQTGQAGDAAPGAVNVEAAAALPPEQRARMIRQMVDGLAQRLKQSPNDLNGWLRLARSYSVLGEPDKARDALDQAADHFKGDAASLARIGQARAALVGGQNSGASKPAAAAGQRRR
jgi:cytochrome c-type biogenesis protein CcmH